MHLLYIGENPIQNTRPYRLMQLHPSLQLKVVYTGSHTAFAAKQQEHITQAAFDLDLLKGYTSILADGKWSVIKNAVNWADVIVIYGHHSSLFKKALFYGCIKRKKIILTTDATYKEATAQSKGWKLWVKPFLLRLLYHHLADAVWVPSTASQQFLESIGIRSSVITVTPYVVDEDFFSSVVASTNRNILRHTWNALEKEVVFIYCAKWIERKRPLDVLKAFANMPDNCRLVMIGEGPLRLPIEQMINELNISERVFLPGLIKYSELPKYYYSADLLVFSSDHEPYGLPVNEAMLCSIPVIVSNRIGARLDLVEEGKTGWVYESANVQSLTEKMLYAALHQDIIQAMGKLAFEKMKYWSSEVNVQRQIDLFMAKGWLN